MDERLKAFYETLERRKSVREFSERPVGPDVLSRLVMTLNRAQSAANRQPWHFIIAEKEGREALDATLTKEGFRGAPLIIAACADPRQAWTRKTDGVNYAWVDVTIAITEMICAATAEGLGACWIAAIDAARVKEILGMPEHIEVVALIAVGYPKDELKREDKLRKPLGEMIHHGKW